MDTAVRNFPTSFNEGVVLYLATIKTLRFSEENSVGYYLYINIFPSSEASEAQGEQNWDVIDRRIVDFTTEQLKLGRGSITSQNIETEHPKGFPGRSRLIKERLYMINVTSMME